jgi:hypothetical protein
MITTATVQDNADRIKRFRASTYLASATANGDQFTAYAVDDIKASITDSESQGKYIREVVVDVNGVKKTQYQLVVFYVDDLIIAASTNRS